MPTLKGLLCNLEWDGSEQPIQEYRTAYGDGYVETYIAVPQIAVPFSIRLRSDGYIAPGLAMFTYIDGEYQCNRNRRNLQLPRAEIPSKYTNVDFRVRQKEVMLHDGTFMGKQWKFQKLNIASDNGGVPGRQAPHNAEYVGTIEVVVLRCYPAPQVVSSNSSQSASPIHPVPRSTRAGNRRTERSPITESDELSSSSSDATPSDQLVPERGDSMGRLFDGACDDRNADAQIFGLDGEWDTPPLTKNNQEQWGPVSTGPKTGTYQPVGQGSAQYLGSQKGGNRASFEWDHPATAPPHAGRVTSRRDSSRSQMARGASGSRVGSERAHAVSSVSAAHATIPENHSSAPSIVINVVHPPSQAGGSRQASIAGSKHSQKVADHQAQGPKLPHEDRWFDTSPQEKEKSSSRPSTNAATNAPGNWSWPVDTDNDAVNLVRPKNDSWSTVEAHAPIPGAWQESGDDWGEATSGTNERNKWDNDGNRDKFYNNNSNLDGWNGEKPNSPGNAGDSNWGTAMHNSPKAASGHDWDENATSGAQQGTWESGNNEGPSNNVGKTRSDDHVSSPVHANGQNSNVGDFPGGSQKYHVNQGWNHVGDNHYSQGNSGSQYANQRSNTYGQGQGRGGNMDGTGWNRAGRANAPHPPSAQGSHANTGQGNVLGPQARPHSVRSFQPAVPSLNLDTTGNQGYCRTSWTPSAGQVNPVSTWLNNTIAAQQAPADAGWSSPTLVRLGSSAQAPSFGEQDHATSSPEGYASVNPFVKSYWSKWKNAGQAHGVNTYHDLLRRQMLAAAEEPLYIVPDEVAQRKGVSHQVQTGKPVPYVHKKSIPRYLDTFENPYAVFVFHYRSKDTIEEMLNVTITETEEEEKQRLQGLSKAEIIDYLMEVKAAASSCNAPNTAGPVPAARNEHVHHESTQHGEATMGALDINALNNRLQNLRTSDHGTNHHTAQTENGRENNPQNGDWGNGQQNNSWDSGSNSGKAMAGAPNSRNAGIGGRFRGGNTAQAGNNWDNVQQNRNRDNGNGSPGYAGAATQGRGNTDNNRGIWGDWGEDRSRRSGASANNDGHGGNQSTWNNTGGDNRGGDNGGQTASWNENKDANNGQADGPWNAGQGGGDPTVWW